jgi:hypothetical protein
VWSANPVVVMFFVASIEVFAHQSQYWASLHPSQSLKIFIGNIGYFKKPWLLPS